MGRKQKEQFSGKRLRTGETRLLCDSYPATGMIKAGRYYFNPASVKFGEQILLSANPKELCIVDEVGLFEVKGLVWGTVLQSLIQAKKNPLLISVRTSFTDQVIQHFIIHKPIIFSLEIVAVQIFEKIMDELADLDLGRID